MTVEPSFLSRPCRPNTLLKTFLSVLESSPLNESSKIASVGLAYKALAIAYSEISKP